MLGLSRVCPLYLVGCSYKQVRRVPLSQRVRKEHLHWLLRVLHTCFEQQTETWVPTAGFQHYIISTQPQAANRMRYCRLRKLDYTNGYVYVSLQENCMKSSWLVHRLLLESMLYTKPDHDQCDHMDGNRRNNKFINL